MIQFNASARQKTLHPLSLSLSLSFCAGQWFPHGAECHRLHFQHHRDRREQILLHLPLILLQSAVQLSQHSAVCRLNLGAHCGGDHPQFLRRLPALRPEGLFLHLRPECQQLLHRGGGGGSLFCSHRSGYLLLSTHLGACDSGQSSASLLLRFSTCCFFIFAGTQMILWRDLFLIAKTNIPWAVENTLGPNDNSIHQPFRVHLNWTCYVETICSDILNFNCWHFLQWVSDKCIIPSLKSFFKYTIWVEHFVVWLAESVDTKQILKKKTTGKVGACDFSWDIMFDRQIDGQDPWSGSMRGSLCVCVCVFVCVCVCMSLFVWVSV